MAGQPCLGVHPVGQCHDGGDGARGTGTPEDARRHPSGSSSSGEGVKGR